MEALLKVEDLRVHFPIGKGILRRSPQYVHAVDGVSFTVQKGEIVGLVGESGCGKTTAGLALLRLVEPTGGRVLFQDTDIARVDNQQLRAFRRRMQIIFQDPYASLNPRMVVKRIICDPMKIHGISDSREREDRLTYLLDKVGLSAEQAERYPHEFSGGQRQRIGIARALALDPQIIIADEPVSALDVSIQAQIINLLIDLQEEFGLSYIFISHDLALVEYVCDTVAVMYLGKLVEVARYRDLYTAPLHPYTQALMSAIPVPDPRSKRTKRIVTGDVPSPIHPPSGCRFHPRCPDSMDDCPVVEPDLTEVGPNHFVACLRCN